MICDAFQDREALALFSNSVYFSPGKDSHSVVTMLLAPTASKAPEFHADLAILSKNVKGDFQRLIHNKQVFSEGYTWCKLPDSHRVGRRADMLRQ